MGVPRFFRWLSERYPCTMENVDKNTCPEFDNLYLDMNGVIHNCSHPSDDIHFRLPEDVIFRNIVEYVEYLFNLIAPRKVLFLSVDGVAPRSKMNQQRSRRYKSAQEALAKEKKALDNNETLPTTPRFDSNCITPGTEFMSRLHAYMIEDFAKNVQTNPAWKNVEIIYSGFDVPGEGEHKIMDYIRTCKAADENQDQLVRHCLYGLDADLINLGLCSHEPFFSILREEVKFGKPSKATKKTGTAYTTNFQLLHLSVLRDYLDSEFCKLKTTLKSFAYNLENVIDDWILLNFLIGNDFLPHVPMFHVERGSLEILYKTYLQVLPTLSGYMNINGEIHLGRFKKFLEALAVQDFAIYKKNFIEMDNYADALNALTFGTEASSEPTSAFDSSFNEADVSSLEPTDNDDDDSDSLGSDEENFSHHKKCYYQQKLHFKEDFQNKVVQISNEYVRGLQWVLIYYYRGCPSWNWFYPDYYAPYVSDLRHFNLETIEFDLSTPFPPLVQLLAVLPIPSKSFLPEVFQNIVVSPVGPLTEFFPEKVELDMNEKKQDYEAIVLIPFIREEVIMAVYETCKNIFSGVEKKRNHLGCHHSMKYSDSVQSNKDAGFAKRYPNIKVVEHAWNAFIIPKEQILFGLRKNVSLDVINGFPTLKGIPYIPELKHAKLKIHDFPSKDVSIILRVLNTEYSEKKLSQIIEEFGNNIVYVNWPLISEAKLVEIITKSSKYSKNTSSNHAVVEPTTKEDWCRAFQDAKSYAYKLDQSRGIHFRDPETIAKVVRLESQRFVIRGSKVILEKTWHEAPTHLPLELLVCSSDQLKNPPVYKDLKSVFFPGQEFFVLTKKFYGVKGEVVEYIRDDRAGQVKMEISLDPEPTFGSIHENRIFDKWFMPEYNFTRQASRKLNISEKLVRKVMGSIIVDVKSRSRHIKLNLGLKLHFQQKCIPGYVWVDENNRFSYHSRCFDIIEQYHTKFPWFFELLDPNSFAVIDLTQILPEKTIEEKSKIALGIKDWLDTLDHFKVGHFERTTKYIDTSIVKEVENRVKSHVASGVTATAILSPRDLYVPEFIVRGEALPDPRVNFRLYDRVVNVKQQINVKFGEKGTVIGIYSPLDFKSKDLSADDLKEDSVINLIIEVLFDNPVVNGIACRSSAANVYRMKPSHLINISFGSYCSSNNSFPAQPATTSANVSNGKSTASPKKSFPVPMVQSENRAASIQSLLQSLVSNNQNGLSLASLNSIQDDRKSISSSTAATKASSSSSSSPVSDVPDSVPNVTVGDPPQPQVTVLKRNDSKTPKKTPTVQTSTVKSVEKSGSSKQPMKQQIKVDGFVPLAVQRKANPKAKTPQKSESGLNHSANSPFKAIQANNKKTSQSQQNWRQPNNNNAKQAPLPTPTTSSNKSSVDLGTLLKNQLNIGVSNSQPNPQQPQHSGNSFHSNPTAPSFVSNKIVEALFKSAQQQQQQQQQQQIAPLLSHPEEIHAPPAPPSILPPKNWISKKGGK